MATGRDSDSPRRPEWERHEEEVWPAMPRNPELARQAVRDAQRVVVGKLSEEEFYEKYHEAYLREFGFDHRTTGRQGPGPSKAGAGNARNGGGGSGQGDDPPRPMTNKPVSRRAFLMLAAGGATAMALTTALGRMVPNVAYGASPGSGGSSKPQGAGEQSQHAGPVQMGMVIDLENCTGCLACVDGCHRENNLEPGVHWMYVMAYKEEDQKLYQEGGQELMNLLVRPCQHCTDPPCVKVCPSLARHKREKDGLVLTDYDVCIGTRYCQVACPYGVNYFQWGEPQPQPEWMRAHRGDYRGRWVGHNPPRGVMGKCTFCPQRQDSEARRGTTACQQACPHNAIFFGDMNDPNSPPRRHLEKKRQEKDGRLSTFRLLEEAGTEPNIIYIGHQPSNEAKQVKGPTRYEEDWGWVDKRGTVLEGSRPWFMRVFGG